jgi:cytochrome c oxidase subunit 2
LAVPSFKLLYFADHTEKADMTIKVVGHQWYWQYYYPDHGNFTFDSYIIPDDKIQPGQNRLLEVDNQLVLPVGENIRVLLTSVDVIHSWAVPALGVKTDTVPGRINETWFRINKEGVYYGQCSELCGYGHGFMPIAIKAVSKTEFDKWVIEAKSKFSK